MRKNRLLLLLALLMTAATGAWADETLLLTIESQYYSDFKSGSKTFDDKVTVTFSDEVENDGDSDGWYRSGAASLLTVAGINGYTITSCKFYTKFDTASTGYTVEGESPSVYLSGGFVYTDANQSVYIGSPGINKIEVYGGVTPAGYTVSMKDGVKDADKWTISPNPAPEGSPVTIQYTGRLKVKGVKATSEAAAPSVPDGALSGVFSVSDTKKVYFSKGNLQATYNTSWSWAFATNQWDYIGNAAGNTSINGVGTISGTGTVDLFGWVGAACAWTGAAQYGISNEKAAAQYGNVEGEALKSDWGTLAITNGGNTANFGWRSLASDEWEYLFKTRTTPSGVRYAHATVNDVPGLVLLPDDWSADYYSLNKVNDAYDTAYTDNVISSSDWTSKLEAHGAVFLPAGGNRGGATVNDAGNRGNYWSSTPGTSSQSACYFYFGSGRFMGNTSNSTRNRGCSVRLVCEVATTDAPAAKPAATVTAAPTGAAVVGVGKTTALVSGGVADGGTLWYAVTTTNTMPTSTAGFSDAVPTAKDITASGKVYVWYYVKGDDTHSDSEIAATAIEVPVADIVWDVTNASDLYVEESNFSYEKDGVTLSGNGNGKHAWFDNDNNPTTDGIVLMVYESGGFTFTAPTGKAFTKIEMKDLGGGGWATENLGTGWAFNAGTVTWKGTAASTVGLLTDDDDFDGPKAIYIAFYLVDAE